MSQTRKFIKLRKVAAVIVGLTLLLMALFSLPELLKRALSLKYSGWDQYVSGEAITTTSPTCNSHDGVMVYVSPCSGNGDIYGLHLITGSSFRITSSPEYEDAPLITRDGSNVYFSREENGFHHIWTKKTRGSVATQLTKGPVHDIPRQLSDNEKYLLIQRSTGFRFDRSLVSENKLLRLGENPGKLMDVGIGASMNTAENMLAYTRDGIDIFGIDLSSPDAAHILLPVKGYPISFSFSGRYLLFGKKSWGNSSSGKNELWVWDFDSNTERYIDEGRWGVLYGTKSVNAIISTPTAREDDYAINLDSMAKKTIPSSGYYRLQPTRASDHSCAIILEYFELGKPGHNLIIVDEELNIDSVVNSVGCNP